MKIKLNEIDENKIDSLFMSEGLIKKLELVFALAFTLLTFSLTSTKNPGKRQNTRTNDRENNGRHIARNRIAPQVTRNRPQGKFLRILPLGLAYHCGRRLRICTLPPIFV